MNIDRKQILASIQGKIKFAPIDDRILVKPLKQVTMKKKITVPDDEANKGKNPHEDVMETKVINKSVPANHQLGVVLKKGTSVGACQVPFEEGDVVVYPVNAGVDFELFKDSRLLKRYEIVGIWHD